MYSNLVRIIKLKKLNKLILHNCYSNVNQLPEYLSNIKNLEVVKLLRTNLLLPTSIGGLSQLKELFIRENTNIKKLPEDIGNCKSLKRIEIEETLIEELPESITQLPNLEYLDVSYNDIKQLPEKIGNLSKLEHLNLQFNNVDNIPESIGDLSNLKGLSLIEQSAGHIIHSLPKSILKLSKLEGTDLHTLKDDKEYPWIQEYLKTVRERKRKANK